MLKGHTGYVRSAAFSGDGKRVVTASRDSTARVWDAESGRNLGLHSIGTGLILGGILTVGHGYFRYWPYLEDWVRFVSLLAGFSILLFVGYWRVAAAKRN